MRKFAFIVAATHSGAGKTTCTLGVMAALKRRGIRVQPFKVGPDFIDPGHHTAVTGIPSRNLDGWMLSRAYNKELFSRLVRQADGAVVEGVMGLFDGYEGTSDSGSTAEMAKWLKLPVVLIVDAASMARSAAAVIKGFEAFDEGVSYAGVIFNRVGSQSHLSLLKEAVSRYCEIPCLGGFIRDDRLVMPERHLGLVTSEEAALSGAKLDYLIEVVEESLDLDKLLETCKIPFSYAPEEEVATVGKKARIAVARDAAFCFYYPDNLDILEQMGAELVPFSPLKDKALPPDCSGIYLGGGYPEEFAEPLASNAVMRTAIREAGQKGVPIYAECGGFMYLCEEIVARDGKPYPMVGLFPMATRMLQRFRALGYREITLLTEGPLGKPGMQARGHEFHYSEVVKKDLRPREWAYQVTGRKGAAPWLEGYRAYNTLASYIHLHFGSNPEIAKSWVDYCKKCNVLT